MGDLRVVSKHADVYTDDGETGTGKEEIPLTFFFFCSDCAKIFYAK